MLGFRGMCLEKQPSDDILPSAQYRFLIFVGSRARENAIFLCLPRQGYEWPHNVV